MMAWSGFQVQLLSEAGLKLRAFQAEDAAVFRELNLAWIEEHFGVEDEDLRQLNDPHANIIGRGGFIAVAEWNGAAVGTGGVLPAAHPPHDGLIWYEIIKMATTHSAQGKGVGGAVLDRLIAQARNAGAQRIWLETNNRLAAASALYRRKGFVALSPAELWETPYSRCNLQMALEI